jgi:O-antigen/teichoic acid export membrane protein
MFKLDAVNGFQIFVVLRFSFVILISIAMAKVGLPLEEIGVYEALILIGATFTFFWMTGLMNGLLPTYPTLSEIEQPAFIFNLFVLLVTTSWMVTGWMWYFQDVLTQMMTNFRTLPYFHWLCLYLALNLPTSLIEYLYILGNKPKPMISFGLFSFSGQFLAIILPLWFGWSLEWSFIGLVILALAKYFWLIPLLIKYSRIDWHFQRLVPYFWIALPIIVYTLVGGVMSYIDGTIIMKYFDESQFAIYRIGAREFPLSLALLTAMSTALVSSISEHLPSGLGQIKHRTGKLMLPLFGASILLMFISPLAYPLVFREDFADSAWVFNVYLLILINRILLPQTILIGLKKTKIILIASVLETGLNLGLSLILIQYMGLIGVALATMIAFTVEKIILVAYCSIQLKIGLSKYLEVKRYSFYSLLLIGSYFLSAMLF